jgi:hypothetical protein
MSTTPAAASLGKNLFRSSGPHAFIRIENEFIEPETTVGQLLLHFDLEGDDLALEPAFLERRFSLLLAFGAEFVLLVPGDPVLLRDVLGRQPHTGKGPWMGVHQRGIGIEHAPAHGDLAHAFNAPGNHHVRETAHDLLCGDRNGLEAR